jgi:Immunity protein 52
MNTDEDCPELLVRCRPEDYSLGEFSDKAHAYLSELIPLHPLFSDLRLVGKNEKDSPPLQPNLANLQDWILRRAWWTKMPTGLVYSDLDQNSMPTEASRGGMGFKIGVSNLKSWDGKVAIDMRSSLSKSGNTCNIILPRKNYPEFYQQPLMGQLLELVVEHWPAKYASVSNIGWNNAVNWVGEHASRAGQFEIGWLTYVADPSVAEALPSKIQVRRFGQGVIFQLTEEFSSYKNPEHVALGLRVKEALAAASKLQFKSATS